MKRIIFALVGIGSLAGAVAHHGSCIWTIGRRCCPDLRDQASSGIPRLALDFRQATDRCGRRAQAVARPIGQRHCDQRPFGKGSCRSRMAQSLPRCIGMKIRQTSDNQALAAGFPGLGLESSFAGSAVNVQFMVKDSKKYAASGGWGFADFTNGKPGDEALHAKCFPCHQPAKDRDYVFTHYAPTP